jgi:hypothetical protein
LRGATPVCTEKRWGYAVGAHDSARCGSPSAGRPPDILYARRHYAHRRLARLGLVQLMVPTRGGRGRAWRLLGPRTRLSTIGLESAANKRSGVGANVLRASGLTVSSTSHVRRPMSERTSQDFAFVPGCLASVDAEPVSQATNTRQVSGTSRRCVTGLRVDLKRERRDRASSVGGTMRSRAWPS